ncbi:MAG: hypothetical protein LLP51_08060 [Halorhodospira halophila]|uniref:hypothetical protein n=1 Tax=Halorhodospira TaxID=85108 RepID=UPI0019119A5F|nr:MULTISPECIES: hypothetical protein [Halorhodospira]MCC3751334.1 hypothetical protein [Halorhodospira halophila]MCG5527989.1 hypothetical protein [Halorhodospira halophila]MCG5533317.1 hypothetical protein [Halorhodospira sp. 9621]MCG5539213.1 hypothetical protein [Halorhodospira sp. 9622]MCG5539570.1 hypothetical protein [Halorhodospira sp. M39old]
MSRRLRRWVGAGCLGIAGALMAACSGGDAGTLAADYCDYIRNADDMPFEQQQEAITALDERYQRKGIRESSIRVAIQRECPDALAEHDVRMLGVLGEMLRETRDELQELR